MLLRVDLLSCCLGLLLLSLRLLGLLSGSVAVVVRLRGEGLGSHLRDVGGADRCGQSTNLVVDHRAGQLQLSGAVLEIHSTLAAW